MKMDDPKVKKKIKNLGLSFQNCRKIKPLTLFEKVVREMNKIGGITGITVKSNKSFTLQNHTDSYSLPIVMPEYNPNGNSSDAKRKLDFFYRMRDYLREQKINYQNIEYHLGKHLSSKHHQDGARYAA